MVKLLRAKLDARGLQAVGIDACEDSYEQDTLNALDDYPPNALGNISHISTHTYSANNPAGLRNLAVRLRKPLWMTEYGQADATGMTLARRIHDDITMMCSCAWIYWQVVDSGAAWGLIANPEVASTNSRYTTSYTIHESFYVMGQFSEFIRPGFEIITAGDTNTLAAYSPANRTLVLVAVNDTSSGFKVTYDLSAFRSAPSQASVHRTSAGENLAALSALRVAHQRFTPSLPAQSVTTFVLTNVTLAATTRIGKPAR